MKTPKVTLQMLNKKGSVPPKERELDLGIQDISINWPEISFRRDRPQATNNINIGQHRESEKKSRIIMSKRGKK
jgi:hypothetical protein